MKYLKKRSTRKKSCRKSYKKSRCRYKKRRCKSVRRGLRGG